MRAAGLTTAAKGRGGDCRATARRARHAAGFRGRCRGSDAASASGQMDAASVKAVAASLGPGRSGDGRDGQGNAAIPVPSRHSRADAPPPPPPGPRLQPTARHVCSATRCTVSSFFSGPRPWLRRGICRSRSCSRRPLPRSARALCGSPRCTTWLEGTRRRGASRRPTFRAATPRQSCGVRRWIPGRCSRAMPCRSSPIPPPP